MVVSESTGASERAFVHGTRRFLGWASVVALLAPACSSSSANAPAGDAGVPLRDGAPAPDAASGGSRTDASVGATTPDGSAGPDASPSDVHVADSHAPEASPPHAPSADAGTLACGSPFPEYTSGNGSVTYYTLGMGSAAVNCSFPVLGENPDTIAFVATGQGQYFGAMNTSDYNGAAVCGACVEVSRSDTAQKVDITIVDQCPSASNPDCKAGHIDLSEQAFLQIGTTSEGYLGTGNGGAVGTISWKYIPCPVATDVSYSLKDPTNQYWNEILVEGHRYPVTAVEVDLDGTWTPATRESYNYWQVGSGDLGTAPYAVRVTDTNGSQIEASLALASGDQPSPAQFPLCQ
jgi:expansin (peptidoglycan-binding protein)